MANTFTKIMKIITSWKSDVAITRRQPADNMQPIINLADAQEEYPIDLNTYATVSALPSPGTTGEIVYVTEKKECYRWDGSAWAPTASAPATGHVCTAVLTLTQNASGTETIGIGSDTMTFGTNIVVGADTDETLTNIETWINNTGTENVFATANLTDDTVTIELADAPGGTVILGRAASTVLATTVTNATWSHGNLTATGRTLPLYQEMGVIILDATNAATAFDVPLSFDPDFVHFKAWSESSGVYTRKDTTATVKPITGGFTFNAAAGGTPLASGDYVSWHAWQAL